MQLRVRSLDGVELVLDVPQYTVHLQVAVIKRLSLERLLQLRGGEELATAALPDEETKDSEPSDAIHDAPTVQGLGEKMATTALVFRGQILADVDDVNLFAVAPSDFFVLVEEIDEDAGDAGDDDGDAATGTEEEDRATTHKRRRVGEQNSQREKYDASVMQLMEMGFDIDQARNALELSNGELSRAVAILMGEAFGTSKSAAPSSSSASLRGFVAKLIRQYPELAAIESLLMVEDVHRLKRIAMKSDFDAFVVLKESFPAHWLAQMNENPAAMVLFLSLPQHFESEQRPVKTHPQKAPEKAPHREIDLTIDVDGDLEIVDTSGSSNPKDQDAIARLISMGFAHDLVAAVYESCGGNEEVAANLLFETLA